jgi:hypothetical protein
MGEEHSQGDVEHGEEEKEDSQGDGEGGRKRFWGLE